VQAGNFTLTVDVGEQDLSAPLALQATLRIFESAQQRNVTAQPVCVLAQFVANNVSSCSWELDQSDGFLTIELATVVANSDRTLTGYGVTLAFVPRATAAPTPLPTPQPTSAPPTSEPTTAPTLTVAVAATSADTASVDATTTAAVSESAATNTAAAAATGSIDVPLIVGVAGGAVVLLAAVGVAVAIGMRRRAKSAPSDEVPMTTSVATDKPPQRTSEYGPTSTPGEYGAAPPAKSFEHGPISVAEAHGEYASMRADSQASLPSSNYERWSDNGAAPKSQYASTAAEFTRTTVTCEEGRLNLFTTRKLSVRTVWTADGAIQNRHRVP
jgi:hypothetical protein